MSLPTPSRVKSELAREPMRQVCLRMADQIVGISTESLESLVGKGTTQPARHRVVHYAIDTKRFLEASEDRAGLRREMGFESTARVLLFVGRIVEYKNPCFLLEMLDHVAQTDASAVVVFAGAGNQENEIRELAKQKSLEDRVKLLGFRDDVPELMTAADLLVWPSLENPMEGLGLGIVEAQAAGLPVLMSRSVPEEAIVVPELVTVLPLNAGPQAWAREALEILNRRHPARSESRERVEASSFSMKAGVANLMALYDDLED
jgi:glycosyltransferase involved in cell wall biosynthesis